MTHPCDGHLCDHCYACDVVGVCCATLSGGLPAETGCCPDTAAVLREAIQSQATDRVLLVQLIRPDGALPLSSHPVTSALPAGVVAVVRQPAQTTTKEAQHVDAA